MNRGSIHPFAMKLDLDTKACVEQLAEARHRSLHW